MLSRKIGSLTVLELHTFCQEYGRGFLPYPFRFTKPVPYQDVDEMDGHRRNLIERLASGEFDHLRRWLDIQMRKAELRVESMFMNTSEITAAFSATRWQDLGFIANQDSDDIISVSQLSAYDLGREIGTLAQLSGKPGSHPKVTIPSLNVHMRSAQPSSSGSVIDEVKPVESADVISFDELIAGGEIYTDHRPPRRWAPDRTKDFIGWVNTADGDYVVQAPYEYATPVTPKAVDRQDRSLDSWRRRADSRVARRSGVAQ